MSGFAKLDKPIYRVDGKAIPNRVRRLAVVVVVLLAAMSSGSGPTVLS